LRLYILNKLNFNLFIEIYDDDKMSYIKLLPLDIVKNEIIPKLSQRSILNLIIAYPSYKKDIKLSDYKYENIVSTELIRLDAVLQINEIIIYSGIYQDGIIDDILIRCCEYNNILMFKDYIGIHKEHRWMEWIPYIIANDSIELLDEFIKYMMLRPSREDDSKKIAISLSRINWCEHEEILCRFYDNIQYCDNLFDIICRYGNMKILSYVYTMWKDYIKKDIKYQGTPMKSMCIMFCNNGKRTRDYTEYISFIKFLMHNADKVELDGIDFEEAMCLILYYTINDNIISEFRGIVKELQNVGREIHWQRLLTWTSGETYDNIIVNFKFLYEEGLRNGYVFKSERRGDILDEPYQYDIRSNLLSFVESISTPGDGQIENMESILDELNL
ncbi:Hypothetical protein ORPV_204, partial [Orpheovirus IHUMI-LCC2]